MVAFLDDFFESYDVFNANINELDAKVSDFAFSFCRDKYLISRYLRNLVIRLCILVEKMR